MKNKSILILFMALFFLFMQACQYEYPMIAPQRANQYEGDSLEEEDAGESGGGDENTYFVSVTGNGEMDGSSWDDAMDVEGLRILLTGGTDLSDKTVYIAEGKYIIGRGAGLGLTLAKNIKAVIGGFSSASTGTDVTLRNSTIYKTVFSGDVNGNNVPDEGDCCLFIVSGGTSLFDGITFECGYINESLSVSSSQGAGPVFGIKGTAATTCVEAVNCIFQNNLSAAGTNSVYAGGSCAYVYEGYFKAKGCQFLNNKARSRGGVVRLMKPKAVAFFDKCYFAGNQLSDSGSAWGMCIQVTDGCCLINNCTMTGNKGIGGDINGGGAFLVVNTTVINNADDTFGAFRCESKANTGTHFMNNALLSEKDNGVGFVYQISKTTDVRDITSSGYNLLTGYTGNGVDIKKPTDVVYGSKISGEITDGCFVWDQTKISAINTYAKLTDVVSTVRAFNPSLYAEINSLGEAYFSWVGESGFGVDQLGNARNPEKMQRGSYDAALK